MPKTVTVDCETQVSLTARARPQLPGRHQDNGRLSDSFLPLARVVMICGSNRQAEAMPVAVALASGGGLPVRALPWRWAQCRQKRWMTRPDILSNLTL